MTGNVSTPRRSRVGDGWIFLMVQAIVVVVLFREALWGRVVLAPLDVAPSLYSELQATDPSIHLPQNHCTLDQLVYDYPLQGTIHAAYRRGEIPWWDPYTYGGRPFLADAHINGMDPVRVLTYLALPFDLAYNWTKVFHFILSGVGMFLLLRRLGIGSLVTFWLALAWQFAGIHIVTFGHPWVTASFLWYPFLWTAVHHAWETGSRPAALGIAVSTAAIFYAGNLQSHSYLVLFYAALGFGYGGLNPGHWLRWLGRVAPWAAAGALLAAPALAIEMEAFLLNVRPPDIGVPTKPLASAILTLIGAIHPWTLGTYRGLDLSKFAGVFNLGFVVSFGVLGLAGALWQALGVSKGATGIAPVRVGFLSFGFYWFVASTPAIAILYPRAGGLGALGLLVCGAHGLEALKKSGLPFRNAARWMALFTVLLAVGTCLEAYVVWPRVRGRAAAVFEGRLASQAGPRSTTDTSGPSEGLIKVAESAIQSPTDNPLLRQRQLASFPREVSPENPEVLFALLGWGAFAILLAQPQLRSRSLVWQVSFLLSLAPLAHYANRFITRSDIELARRLRQGTPDQVQIARQLNDHGDRLWEPESQPVQILFPGTVSHFLHVRTLRGYAALRPQTIAELPVSESQRWTSELGDAVFQRINGVARFTPPHPGARFHWTEGTGAGADSRFTQEGLNRMKLDFASPVSGTLLWTDTQYPGWRVYADGTEIPMEPVAPCFSQLKLQRPTNEIEFRYRPTHLTGSLIGAGFAALLCLGFVLWPTPSKTSKAG
jgi:hypothetical protein